MNSLADLYITLRLMYFNFNTLPHTIEERIITLYASSYLIEQFFFMWSDFTGINVIHNITNKWN